MRSVGFISEGLRAKVNWQGEAWNFFDAKAQRDSEFVVDAIVPVEKSDRSDKGVEVVVNVVLLKLEGAIFELKAMVGANAPVLIEA